MPAALARSAMGLPPAGARSPLLFLSAGRAPPLGGAGALPAALAGLARLAADHLAGVLHALGLVRVGAAQGADLRRDLAHDLLVDAAHAPLLRRLHLERDPRGRVDLDGG